MGWGVRDGDGWGWEVAVVWRGVCGVDDASFLRGNRRGESVLEGEAEEGAFSLSLYITPEEAEKIAEMVG